MQEQSTIVWRWIVVAVAIIAFLVVDFATPFWFGGPENEWIWATMLGICIGQVNLIAAWAAIGPGNIVVRLPWSALLGVMMWYAMVLGNRANHGISLDQAVILGAILFAGLVIAQLPLWIARKTFRWRLIREGGNVATPDGPLQFNLSHMLLGTFLLSVALSPCRVVLPHGPLTHLHLDHQLPVLLSAVALCNLVVTVPCIWGALLTKARTLPLAAGWLVYCAILTGVEFGALCAMLGPPKAKVADSVEVAAIFYFFNVVQCVAVFIPLRIFRAFGYRMVRLPRRAAVAGLASPAAALYVNDGRHEPPIEEIQ